MESCTSGKNLRIIIQEEVFRMESSFCVTKTKIAKPLPIIPELMEIIKPEDLSPLVFTHKTRAGLVPYRRQYLEGIWNEANRLANQKYGTPLINLYNGLKHSFGVQRLNQGFSIEQIKEVFGHVDVRSTQRYTKFLTQKLINVMRGKIVDLSAKRVQEK